MFERENRGRKGGRERAREREGESAKILQKKEDKRKNGAGRPLKYNVLSRAAVWRRREEEHGGWTGRIEGTSCVRSKFAT